MTISIKQKRHRSHHRGNTSQDCQRVMRAQIAIHRDRTNGHRPRGHVAPECHETEGGCGIGLVHEDDIEVNAGEDGDEAVAEEC